MTPTRPLTHDLFKSLVISFEITVREVVIYNLNEGIFYAKLICDREGQLSEIDARTSDAIALAVRFKCPIYTFENILSAAGIMMDENAEFENDFADENLEQESTENPMSSLSVQELEAQLNDAIDNEEYERASKIRDEINKRTS
jgi:bifunctional DNase/RNase